MKYILYFLLAILSIGCANHSDDGLYVGSISLGYEQGFSTFGKPPKVFTTAWIINGDMVTICENGRYRRVELVRSEGFMIPNDGALSLRRAQIDYDSSGIKCLRVTHIMTEQLLKKVSEENNISPTEVIEKYKIVDNWAQK